MNGILRNRVSSCATRHHIRIVLYSTSPAPFSISSSPTSNISHTPPTSQQQQLNSSDPQSLPLPNGALSLPHGLTMRKKPSRLVTYRDLTAEQLLDVIYQRKKDGEPQELLNFIYLLMEYRKSNNTQGIMNAVVLMKEVGVEPNNHIFNMLITHFGLLKDASTVKELMTKMRNKGYDLADANYNMPIQAFLTSKDGNFYQDGIDTFYWAAKKGVPLRSGTYFSLISHAINKGDEETCKEILAEMTKHGEEPPDSKDLFDMYISARSINRDYKGVLEKYAEMRSLNLFPNYPSYTYIFKAAGMLRDTAQIHAAWKDLRSTMGPAPLIATYISHYNSYVRSLAQVDDTQGCIEAITQLRADGLKPIARTYIPVIEALNRRRDAASLERLLGEAKEDGFEFNGPLLEIATKVIGGDKLDEMRKLGKRPTVSAYNSQLSQFSKAGDHSAFMRTVEEMTRDGIAYDAATYHILLSQAHGAENAQEVRRLHAKMVAEGLRPDAVLYNTLAQSYTHMRDTPACTQLVDTLLRERILLPTPILQSLITVMLENKDISRCYAMLDRMRSPTQEAFDVPTYGRIIDLMLRNNDILGCNRLLAEMQSKGVKPTLHIYNSLIGFAAQKGDKNWVSVLMNEISTQGLRADMSTYSLLFEGLAMIGDAEGCDAWVATMRTHGLSPSRAIYHNIISCKAMRGDAEACGRLVREMGIRGMNPEPQAYTMTLHLLVRKGDQLNCRAVYDDMKSKGVVPDRTTYNLLALVSSTEDGLKLLSDMRENAVSPDADTYRALLGSMAWRGDVDGCRRALVEMDRDRVIPDIETYNHLVANLGRHVDTKMLCNRLLEGIPPPGFTPYPEFSTPVQMYQGMPDPMMAMSSMPPLMPPVINTTIPPFINAVPPSLPVPPPPLGNALQNKPPATTSTPNTRNNTQTRQKNTTPKNVPAKKPMNSNIQTNATSNLNPTPPPTNINKTPHNNVNINTIPNNSQNVRTPPSSNNAPIPSPPFPLLSSPPSPPSSPSQSKTPSPPRRNGAATFPRPNTPPTKNNRTPTTPANNIKSSTPNSTPRSKNIPQPLVVRKNGSHDITQTSTTSDISPNSTTTSLQNEITSALNPISPQSDSTSTLSSPDSSSSSSTLNSSSSPSTSLSTSDHESPITTTIPPSSSPSSTPPTTILHPQSSTKQQLSTV